MCAGGVLVPAALAGKAKLHTGHARRIFSCFVFAFCLDSRFAVFAVAVFRLFERMTAFSFERAPSVFGVRVNVHSRSPAPVCGAT